METIGTELPKLITKVRDEILPMYLEIGHSGIFAATLMQKDLDRASKAMIEGDIIEMLKAYQSLKNYKT